MLRAHKLEQSMSCGVLSNQSCSCLMSSWFDCTQYGVHGSSDQHPDICLCIVYIHIYISSCWFQLNWRICSSNWIISPGIGVNNKKIFELPTPSIHTSYTWMTISGYSLAPNPRPSWLPHQGNAEWVCPCRHKAPGTHSWAGKNSPIFS